MSNNKQIPTALEFLHRDESGVYNEVDITQAMDDYAKLHVERIKQFLYEEICERRDYSASKMCEEVLKFIEQMNNNKLDNTIGIQWDEYGNPNPIINGGDNMNNNPGNTDNNTLNMTALRNYITMYLDDIDAYGEENELTEATNVLHDFVTYLKSMRGMVDGIDDDQQAMIDYNAMEEEWEMDNYNEMQNGTK